MNKLRIRFAALFITTLFLGTVVQAQQATLTTVIPSVTPEAAPVQRWPAGLSLFVTGYPLPIIKSEGLGFGLEYSVLRSTAIAVSHNKTVNGHSDGYFGREEKHTNQFDWVAVKYAPWTIHSISPYVAAGYVKGEMSSFIQPPLFAGRRADTHIGYQGAFPSVGFKAELIKTGTITLVMDASVSYAPGVTATSQLIQDSPPTPEDWAGTHHLETKLAYGWQPIILVGALF